MSLKYFHMNKNIACCAFIVIVVNCLILAVWELQNRMCCMTLCEGNQMVCMTVYVVTECYSHISFLVQITDLQTKGFNMMNRKL